MPLELHTATVNGVKGTFIPPGSMNRIAFVLTECVPLWEKLNAAQQVVIDTQADAVKTASTALALRKEEAGDEHTRAERWKEAYTDEHALRLSEQGLLHSGTFWLVIGFVAGAGAAIGIAYALPRGTP